MSSKVISLIKICIFILFIAIIFSIGFAKVNGDSMKPTLNNNDVIIYKKVKNVQRFDIIIFKVNNELFIKRVIGLPGDKIEYINNTLFVNDKVIDENFQKSITKDFTTMDITSDGTIPQNKLLVLGDNRLFSHDSRNFGLIDISNVVGKMIIKVA